MTKPDFSDARAKLNRACKHIADLEVLQRSFLATDFYRLYTEIDEGKGRVELKLESLHQPSKDLNLVFGDAISNLRSTLDYVTLAIAKPVTGRTDAAYFPFADNANGFKGQCSNAALGLDEPLIKHFISEVQTYEGGNGHALWVVNKLRNIDKHRFLLATVENAGFVASWVDRGGSTFQDCRIGGPIGKTSNALSVPIGHITFTKQPAPTFEIRIQEPPFAEGVELFQFLKSAARQAQAILDGLEVVFAGRPS